MKTYKIKSFLCVLLIVLSQLSAPLMAKEGLQNATAKSYVLMEVSTGEILAEKNKDEILPPASITKIMTMLLIQEAIESGKIKWDDVVSISEHAAHMGGSQVFMEPGEQQTVRDLYKCISIASANDAAVAMAEYVAGSEPEFVDAMNQKAKELHMNHTVFKNACGLHEEGHVSTAYDVALMSKELMNRFPEVSKTATIWMDTITHKTRKGESEFGLTNTNKMLKWYQGVTGLKTGYTPQSKFCVSATAQREDMHLVAVIMSAEDGKVRFREAGTLLDYGFANYRVKKGPEVGQVLAKVPVKKGDKEFVEATVERTLSFVVPKEKVDTDLTYHIQWEEGNYAPIYKGQKLGQIVYYLEDKQVGQAELVASYDVGKARFRNMFPYMIKQFFGQSKQISK
jgi:D-alanyl-D-alanine carboxypeptidase (penicillin-binding protein 5/6)